MACQKAMHTLWGWEIMEYHRVPQWISSRDAAFLEERCVPRGTLHFPRNAAFLEEYSVPRGIQRSWNSYKWKGYHRGTLFEGLELTHPTWEGKFP